MHRIDHATAAPDLFGPGKPGFRAGNSTTSTPATRFNPDWTNMVQEAICRTVEAAGMALDKANLDQFTLAIQQMIAQGAFDIGALDALVGAVGGAAELAALVEGVHKRITVDQLFEGRETVDLYARDGLVEVAWQLAVDKSTPAGLFASTGRLNVFASDNLVVKTGATWSAATKTYGNPGTQTAQPGTVGDWLGATAAYTYGVGIVTSITNNSYIRAATSFAGDFEVSFQYSAVGGGADFGLLTVASEGVWANNPDTLRGISPASVHYNGTVYDGASASGVTITKATGVTYKFKRTGTTLELWQDATLKRSWAGVNQTLRFWLGTVNYSGGAFAVSQLTYVIPGNPQNMVLRDTALVLPSAPLDGRLLFLHRWAGAGLYGSDIKAYMCRDNVAGGQWAEAALTVLHPWIYDATYNVVAADFDLSALPAGTAVVPELRTFNTVEQYVRATHYNAE